MRTWKEPHYASRAGRSRPSPVIWAGTARRSGPISTESGSPASAGAESPTRSSRACPTYEHASPIGRFLLMEMGCPACGGQGRPTSLTLPVPEVGSVILVRCRSCMTEYWRKDGTTRGQQSEYWEGYKFELYSDVEVRRSYEERYDRFFRLLGALGRTPTTLLDVGGGIGNFAYWAMNRGLRAYMTDLDASAVAAARERGVRAFLSTELDDGLGRQDVDTVCLWDVIEHTSDPSSLVNRVLGRLEAGGTLFIETPDARFPLRRVLLGLRALTFDRLDRTGGLYYWEHKVYFTEKGIRGLLGRCGAQVVHVERWTSPSAKMVKLLGPSGSIGDKSAIYRALGSVYPRVSPVLERFAIGNKLIVVAVKR